VCVCVCVCVCVAHAILLQLCHLYLVSLSVYCYQCFDTARWASQRGSATRKLSDEGLTWLSVWSEVHIVSIWSSWRRMIPKPYLLCLLGLECARVCQILLFWNCVCQSMLWSLSQMLTDMCDILFCCDVQADRTCSRPVSGSSAWDDSIYPWLELSWHMMVCDHFCDYLTAGDFHSSVMNHEP